MFPEPYVFKIQLTRPVKNPRGEYLYGSTPDCRVEQQTALLAPGTTVRVWPPFNTSPDNYMFSWYAARPDLNWEFMGATGQHWEAAAKKRASEAVAQMSANASTAPQMPANGSTAATWGAQS
jgi:hypothetical protein